MQISSIRQNPYFTRNTVQSAAERPSFQQALGQTGDAQAAKTTPAVSVTLSSAASNASAASDKPDFTSMAPRTFSETAQKMYDNGQVDLDQLFKMQFAAGGIFKDTPASASESTQPVNYVKYFQAQLSMGSSTFGQYGYQKIADIVNVLTR